MSYVISKFELRLTNTTVNHVLRGGLFTDDQREGRSPAEDGTKALQGKCSLRRQETGNAARKFNVFGAGSLQHDEENISLSNERFSKTSNPGSIGDHGCAGSLPGQNSREQLDRKSEAKWLVCYATAHRLWPDAKTGYRNRVNIASRQNDWHDSFVGCATNTVGADVAGPVQNLPEAIACMSHVAAAGQRNAPVFVNVTAGTVC
ncbi:unnamed protein product [Caenorhabditis auriculariae]|uniref:Uncharacterized protein n=1 Tax=Caenorhabditis auriculariae TaxID=2777116 RepID=A0A8S1GPJ6_9PELO|nr:unnamed protein product [Caenorhabditis auriculariae]